MAGPLDVNPRILAETPGRALAFLHGIATCEAIRAQLLAIQYGDETHAEGWLLLGQVCAYRKPASRRRAEATQKAHAELEKWTATAPRRIRLALARLHPEQEDFVFKTLPHGTESVLITEAILSQLDALEGDPARVASRTDDHAALATLARRGFTVEERKRLRGLAKTATKFIDPRNATAEVSLEDLKKLRAWFVEWSEAARTVITRRDHLIRLGLVRRKPQSTRTR